MTDDEREKRHDAAVRNLLSNYRLPRRARPDHLWSEIERRHFDRNAPTVRRWTVGLTRRSAVWAGIAAAAILFALTIDRGAWGFHRGVPIGPAMSSTAAAMPRPEDSAGLAPYFTDAEDLLAAVTVGSFHAANPRDTDRVLTLLAQTDALLASGPGTHTPVSELLSDIELALVHLSGPGDYPLGVSDALSRDALARHRVLPRIREFLASAESGV
jgi:hypothetical protein